ncbi:MAG TPA: PEP-utilizing enzyme [Acidimicrobiia bacterium]
MSLSVDPRGAIHLESGPETFWSTTNIGEALPGVVTPLGWSVWMPAIDIGVRDSFYRMGAISKAETGKVPDTVDERVGGIFYGRACLNVNFLCAMGARLPGTSPDAIASALLGHVPQELHGKNTYGRLPFVAARMPKALVTIRKDVIARATPTKEWRTQWLARMDSLDLDGARGALDDARQKFCEMIIVQAGGVFIGVQSVYDQLSALIKKADLDPVAAAAIVGGQGSHAETEIIFDLWKLGHGEMELEEFIAEHGYHGPFAGEISSHVWREDPTPVIHLAQRYQSLPDSQHPARQAAERTAAREEAEKVLLARLPSWQRPGAKLVLKLAVTRIPLRGVAKAAYLQSLDVVRASGRRLGVLLTEQGVLDEPDDAFYLTDAELLGRMPAEPKMVVAERRLQRREFQRHNIPTNFNGTPEPFEITGPEENPADTPLSGIGASGGIVEGVVRVVHDPTFTDVEQDEVLVCVTTDPSWASVMLLASALVVDIGGLLSHAAVVAREIGVPCVVGTANGTKILHTGDKVRVDGSTGAVEILSRA